MAGASTPNDANKVRFGLKNLTVFPMTDENAPTWGDPIKIPGAVTASQSPEGSSESFYADDGNYFASEGNAGWKIELEMAKFPDEWYVAAYGWRIDDNGGLVEIANAVAKQIAICFEVSGDKHERRNVYYKCTATRPSVDDKTREDTTKPTTEKVTVTAVPMTIGGEVVGRYSLPKKDANKTVYDGFFDAVVKPASAVAAG